LETLDEAGEARTAENCPAFLPQTLAFSGQTFFWPRNLPQERYNSIEPVPKKEIPVDLYSIIYMGVGVERVLKDSRIL
jgi:hypothetical protein